MTDTSSPTPAPAARSPRWMRIALVASVALNMLILGFVGGMAWKFRHHGGRDGHRNSAIERFIASQPQEIQSAIRSSWREAREKRRELRKRLGDGRERMSAVLTADPFDRAAYEQARADSLAALSELRAARLDALADSAARLPASERKAFMEALERRWGRWRR